MGAGFGCPLRLGKDAYCELFLTRDGGELNQAGIGAEKGVTFPIRFNALGPLDCLEGDCDLFKAIARKLVEPKESADEKGSVGRVAKCRAGI